MKRKRKISAVLVDRANYARLKPVLLHLNRRDDVELSVVCAGTMVLERFGNAIQNVEQDGLPVTGRIYLELEGSNPLTMTKSLGFALSEFSNEFQKNRPDLLLVIGDRYEALAATIAAAYMNICIAHVQGGEVSGSIDESARHAISKFAHYHFPSTERSAEYLKRLGERPETVFMYGCPSGDLILNEDLSFDVSSLNRSGVGATLRADQSYLVVLFHPTTTHYGSEVKEVSALFDAVRSMKMQTVWMWPNIDAGSDHISKFLRSMRETHQCDSWARFLKHLEPVSFVRLMAKASCLVGNSSSFVRDASFLGTPVVLVGDRQLGREYSENLKPVKDVVASEIEKAMRRQIEHGRYPPSALYGSGNAGQRIASELCAVPLYVQKTLSFAIQYS